MSYAVVLQRLASQDLNQAYQWAASSAPKTADRWLHRFEEALASLAEHPLRCGRAREGTVEGVNLRELHFGKRPNVYRVIFMIDGTTVRVLRILRAQRRRLSTSEVGQAIEADD